MKAFVVEHHGKDGLRAAEVPAPPGGVALIDHDSFEVTGAWETDRGEQYFAYDVWWHLNEDVAVTSEWGTPSMIEDGLNPEDLLGGMPMNSASWVPVQAAHIATCCPSASSRVMSQR